MKNIYKKLKFSLVNKINIIYLINRYDNKKNNNNQLNVFNNYGF